MRGERKLDRLMVRVDQQEKGVIENRIAEMVFLFDAVSCQSYAEATDIPLFPILFGHLLAVRTEPGEVLDVRAVYTAALKELPASKDRMSRPEHDQSAGEGEKRLLSIREVPIEPADIIVLTVGVVISLLRTADFVASADHRDALRQQQRGEHVAFLAGPQLADGWV